MVSSCQCIPNAAVVSICIAVVASLCLATSTDAFQTHATNPIALHRQLQPTTTSTALSYHHSHHDRPTYGHDRRKFLTTVISGAPLLAPLLALAEEDTDDDTIEVTIDKVETLLKDESELDAEVVQEETDEKKSIEDENKLIDELEKEIAIEESDSSTTKDVEEEANKVQSETEELIKEEEQLKRETEEIITKIESIESDVQSLEDETDDATTTKTETTEKASDAFIDKLKERVEQKEDLITRLKRQSEKDIDPKTGKFKTMSPKEYKERVEKTDTDFLQFLKDTVANEKEWESDLEAFEGFLDKEFGPSK